MNVLQNQRERTFATIRFSRLTNGAGWRVGPEGFVISAAIVVAGDPKSCRRPQNQYCRSQQCRKPGRRFAKPGMRRISEELRGIERREIRSPVIVIALKCSPRC